jgi:Globin
LRLFGERPDQLVLFQFGGISLERCQLPTVLKNHAPTVMSTLGACVAGLTKLDDNMPTLRSLGQAHGVFGIQESHYDVVFQHLMDAIGAELPSDEWDGETRAGKRILKFGTVLYCVATIVSYYTLSLAVSRCLSLSLALSRSLSLSLSLSILKI